MIALDTGFLIYGTQIEATRAGGFSAVQTERVPLAVAQLEQIESSGRPIMVPAPAAWEYVLDFPIGEQRAMWKAMNRFTVAPFDACAARIASQISRRYSDRIGRARQSRSSLIGARQQIKVDIQILAVAIAQRAEAIYTLEAERFLEWSNGLIHVVGLSKALSA